jgi:glycerophosphoryl diester phosphodiesterase
MPERWPFLDWPTPIPYAHRGGGGEQPENTMVAFEAAVKLGYRYLETDVHMTSDGVLVVFHDDDLDPISDRQGRICDLPYAVVRKARVQGEPLPLLTDILEAWPRARVNIDAKHDECVPTLVATLRRLGADDRVCIGSFDTGRVHRLRRLTAGRVCTWMGSRDILRLRLASFHDRIPGRFPDCAQVPMRYGRMPIVDQTFVHGARARGVAVHVWTINDREKMGELLDLGVDGIFSDRPTLLKEVLVERGLWTDPCVDEK